MAVVKKMSTKVVNQKVDVVSYGIINIITKALKKPRENLVKALSEVVSETKPLNVDGWNVTKVVTPTEGLDTEKIRAEMSAEWIKKYSKLGSRTEYKSVSIEGMNLPLKGLEVTPELCGELLAVMTKHAKRQAKAKG